MLALHFLFTSLKRKFFSFSLLTQYIFVFREALARAFRVPVCLPQTAGLSAVQTFGKGRQAIGIKQGRHEESRGTTFSHNDGIALKAALAARQTAGLSCIARQR